MTSDRLLCAALIGSLSLGLAGCSPNPRYVINAPADQTSIECSDAAGMACDVPVNVQWDGVSVRPHPEVTLDGAPLTVAFTSAGSASVATITTGLGSHTLGVSGDLGAKGTIATYSATSTFTVTPKPPPVGGFGLAVNPTDLLVERGKSGTATVTVARMAPFAGAVSIALSNPPTGISAPSVTIPAGSSSGTLTISVSAAASHGKPTLALAATSAGVPNAGAPLRLTVGRETGAFQEANPTPYASNVGQTKTAATGNFRVVIGTGAPSLPQPRKASFFRGNQAVGGDIGFTLGPVSSLGGAGFCANSLPVAITRGVVLSGQMPGNSAQNVITFLDLTVASPQLTEVTADMTTQHSATSPFITFQPRVFFSRDCTVALVAGVNKIGPSMHILRIWDLIGGQPIGAEVPFETQVFSALLRNSGSRQEIEITVESGIPLAPQTVVRNVP